MWPFLVAAGAFVSAVLLRVIDLLIEGRGSWSRRSISADVALFNQLPPGMKKAEAGHALRRRIEDSLLTFGSSETDESEEHALRRQYERDVDLVDVRLNVTVLGSLVVVGLIVMLTASPDADQESSSSAIGWILAVGIAIGFAVVELKTANLIAVAVVRSRWRRSGRRVPPKARLTTLIP